MTDWLTVTFFALSGAIPTAALYGLYRLVGRLRYGPRKPGNTTPKHAEGKQEKPRVTLR